MLTRLLTGLGALGAYGWMLSDPKRAYNTMFDLSDWLTGHVLTGRGTMETMLRNFVNDQMIDQAKAFLLGVAVATLLSVVFWPLSAGTRWVSGRMARAMRGARAGPDGRHRPPGDRAGSRLQAVDADPRIDDDPDPAGRARPPLRGPPNAA